MTNEESIWIGKTLRELFDRNEGFPLLNVGSSTKQFREVEDSHIYKNIFKPVENLNAVVHHLDIKKADGVDIVGDLSDKNFLEKLKKLEYRGILCSNLLEHVINPEEICLAMMEVLTQDGYLIITVPYLYPYHNDPIDTKFRPDVVKLQSMFPNTQLVKGEILTMKNSHFTALLKAKKNLLIELVRFVTPFYQFQNWKKIVADIPNLFKNYKVTCVLLKKL